MAGTLPPLAWFRAFESSARHLSFTNAAQELSMTQSAISQHVRSLEIRFGCSLFLRKSRGLVLTDEGRRLLPNVVSAIEMLRTATEGFEAGEETPTLNIATSISVAQWYLVPKLQEFTQQNNNAVVRLSTKVWPDEFFGSVADVEIRFDAIKAKNTNTRLLGQNRIVTVAAPKYADHKGHSAAEIAELPLIQVVGTSDTWRVWAKQHDYKGAINASYYVDSHGIAVDLAKQGAGIALTSSVVAAPSLNDGSLIAMMEKTWPALDGYHLSISNTPQKPMSEKFALWLEAEIDRETQAIEAHFVLD